MIPSTLRRLGLVAVGVTALSVLMCSNPEDQDPVAWRTAVQVPITSGTFILGDELQKWLDDAPKLDSAGDPISEEGNIRVFYVDSVPFAGTDRLRADTNTGDIVAFGIASTDTSSFDYAQERMEPKRFDVTFGAIPLTNAPAITQTVNIPVVGTLGPAPVVVTLSPRIEYVRFAANSPAIGVTLQNNTAADITNVTVSVTGVGDGTVALVGAGQTATIPIPVAGRSITGTVNAQVTLTAAATGNVSMGFSVNGGLADSVRVQDSLVQISKSFTNDYDLTDSADVDYMDVHSGILNYVMENHSGLSLNVRGVHHDMWEVTWCRLKGWNKKEDLNATRSDSAFFLGNLLDTGSYVVVGPRSTRGFSPKSIANTRIFPVWDSAANTPTDSSHSRSETYVEYLVQTPPPTGAMVSLSSSDSIVFVIRPNFIQGREMFGRLMETFERESDTQDVPVDYPFDSSQIEQMRGKFFFDSMMVDVAIKILLPGRAYMDSVDLTFELYDPADPLRNATVRQKYGRMKNDTVFSQTFNVTSLVNTWPNTLKVRAHALVPKGTEILVINDSVVVGSLVDTTVLGRMTIRGALKYRVKPFFDYRVTSPATIVFGNGGSFDVKGTSAARKLIEPEGTLDMSVENHTNLHVKLRGLIAPDTNGSGDNVCRDTLLKELSVDSLLKLVSTYHPDRLPGGYINILDTMGLYIPARGQPVFANNIRLTEPQLRTFLDSKKAATIWLLTFMQNGRDALVDTDFVNINSSIKVRGIMSTDSLFTKDWN